MIIGKAYVVHLEGSAAQLACHRTNPGPIYSSVIPLTSMQTASLALPRRLAENSKKTKRTKKGVKVNEMPTIDS